MNNEQFRRLVSTNPNAQSNSTSTSPPPPKPSRTLLGARPKSSAPSSSGRSYSSNFFAQKSSNGTATTKKPKTTLPKGTKLAAGYIDRTLTRQDEEDDETAQRLKALEERVKEGEIEVDEFERLRDEITGGEIGRTHLVKGLDRKLLERIRRGEDVLREKEGENEEVRDEDDDFDELEQHEVVASKREERVKQGEKAKIVPGAAIAGQKRTRDQILAEMKAARDAAKAAARPQLGSGFKKIRKDEGPRVEVDERGREVLITVDEEGNVKRRVKKAKVVEEREQPVEEVRKVGKKGEVVLGGDVVVPTYEPVPEEESDEDIFAGAGHHFNPLADLEDDEVSDTEVNAISKSEAQAKPPPARDEEEIADSGSEEGEARDDQPAPPQAPAAASTTTRQNYFNDDPTSLSVLSNIKTDPSIFSALAKSQRAQALAENPHANESVEEAAKRKKREAMLATRDRDMEDMDMGFGGSRFDDAEEMAMEGEKVKFSKWTGGGGGEGSDEEGGKGGGGKRKRGPKKRKGDKNSAADVMGAMEKQRKG
jgi:hypothetical protein